MRAYRHDQITLVGAMMIIGTGYGDS